MEKLIANEFEIGIFKSQMSLHENKDFINIYQGDDRIGVVVKKNKFISYPLIERFSGKTKRQIDIWYEMYPEYKNFLFKGNNEILELIYVEDISYDFLKSQIDGGSDKIHIQLKDSKEEKIFFRQEILETMFHIKEYSRYLLNELNLF